MEKETLYRLIKQYSNSTDTKAGDILLETDSSDATNSELSTIEQINKTLSLFPYFQTARLIYTKELQANDNEKYGDELAKTAILSADRKKLFYLMQSDSYDLLLPKPKKKRDDKIDRTEALLDSFLDRYGNKISDDNSSKREKELEIVPTDYFAHLESLANETEGEKSETQPLQHQDIIDAFIEKNSFGSIRMPQFGESSKIEQKDDGRERAGRAADGEFLTQTLANIYIKQKKYEQAITIIRRLSLNFPKKSTYFADQIRFLEFLIINNKNR